MRRLSLLGPASLLLLPLLVLNIPAAGAVTSPYAYHWPIKPFDRQHPIRGAFGDPRTLAKDQPFGLTGPRARGGYSFHSGIDIVARPGTPVYPVVSGTVVTAAPHKIVVRAGGARTFAYWHLRSNVRRGEEVVAEQTILGWVRQPFDHVHFGEFDKGRAHNPLDLGHLAPYHDHTTPHAIALDFVNGRPPRLTQGGLLGRNDTLAIEAVDMPALPVGGAFAGLPQAPALVQWRLRSGETWSRWTIASDFRRTVPRGAGRFWDVYAPGTYQNSPVFQRQLFNGVPGRYLFRVGLDPTRLAPGPYELEARVADVRGNWSARTWRLRIAGG